MPVAGKPIAEQQESVSIDVDPETALDRVEGALRNRPGAVAIDRNPGRLAATLGSRSLFRTWGAWGPGRRQFPTIVTASVDEAGMKIVLGLREDAGWYAVSNRFAERLYRSQFDEIGRAIRDELGGKAPAPGKGRAGHPSLLVSRIWSIAGVAMIVAIVAAFVTVGILLLH